MIREKFRENARSTLVKMREIFPPTPLQRSDYLSDKYNADIWLKREDLSPVRSYKLRGAFNAMRKQIKKKAFVCASAGNHAQGVAFTSKHLDLASTIFMPVTTPQQKISKTKIFGGANVCIELVGDYFDECLCAAEAFSKENGAYLISPFNDPDVIEGQSTVAAEIEEQMTDTPDVIVLPVGGGGLASGIVSYFGEELSFILVEPAGAASLTAAAAVGEPVKLASINNFTDGAAVARVGELNFEELKNIEHDKILTVPEDRICTTMLEMLNVEGIVLEPAGAMSIDALKDISSSIKGQRVVCVTTGGNFDFERLPEIKERAQRYSGLKKYLILRLPQRPGALKDFLKTLGPNEDITRFEYLKKSARNFGSVLIGIETTSPDQIGLLFSRLDEDGFSYIDITDDEALSQFLI